MTTPIPAPIVVIDFDDLVARVRRLVDRLGDGIDRLLDNARRAAWLLPRAIAEEVDALCARLADLWRRLFAEIVHLLDSLGKPWKVWDTGAAWVERFAGPLSEHLGEMNPLHLSADYEWDGRAAEAYALATARQKEALTALHGIGMDLHSALGNVAVAICAFWSAVAAAVLVAYFEVGAAIVAACTGVGVVAAVAAGLAALSALATGVATGLTAFMLVVERANDAMVTVRSRLHDNSAFEGNGGRWPGAGGERYHGGGWRLAE